MSTESAKQHLKLQHRLETFCRAVADDATDADCASTDFQTPDGPLTAEYATEYPGEMLHIITQDADVSSDIVGYRVGLDAQLDNTCADFRLDDEPPEAVAGYIADGVGDDASIEEVRLKTLATGGLTGWLLNRVRSDDRQRV